MLRDFKDLIEEVKTIDKSRVSVAAANDKSVLEAVKMATDLGFIESVLVGNEEEIRKIAEEIGLTDYEIINTNSDEEAALEAVKQVSSGKADLLMKGLVNTSVYMRAVLNREHGLRTGNLLSLLAVYDLPDYHKLIYASDSGVNVAPDLQGKKSILTNMVNAMKEIGIENPKIAALTANERVDESIPATVEAEALVKMVEDGEIPSCTIEGPISFDIAFDKEAAEQKGVESEVSGDLDGIIFSNMETGNVLGKSWLHFNKAQWAGVILGGSHPVILGSRSDTPEIKLNSIALGCLINNK